MVNPAQIAHITSVTRRGVRIGQVSSQKTPEGEFVPNLGGWWDGARDSDSLLPLDHGWGGWKDPKTPPWKPGHELTLVGTGGIYMQDKHRETIGAALYQGNVRGNRYLEIGRHCGLTVQKDFQVSVEGDDRIHVHGDMHWETRDKLVMGRGNVNRRWEGDIMRMIGMEGVIAGGAFLKTFTGTSTTMTPLASGDVYGGAAQASVGRVRMSATIGYRSSEMCAWACGTYLRAANHVMEPITGTPEQDAPRKKWMQAGRIGLGLCPVADIIWGVCMLVKTIAQAIIAKIKGIKRPGAPQGKPRVHIRNGATVAAGRVSDKIL